MITGVQDSALHTENIEEHNIVEEKEKQLQAALHYLRNTPHSCRRKLQDSTSDSEEK